MAMPLSTLESKPGAPSLGSGRGETAVLHVTATRWLVLLAESCSRPGSCHEVETMVAPSPLGACWDGHL